jgi:hypothetical protein
LCRPRRGLLPPALGARDHQSPSRNACTENEHLEKHVIPFHDEKS